MKKYVYIIIALGLSGCARSCARFEKRTQTSPRFYRVSFYSGGKEVFSDSVRTMINSEDNSDGIYYYKGDTLIEISGDYILKSLK